MTIVTDSLGFRLELRVALDDMAIEAMPGRGQHKTYEQDGKVTPDASHTITINSNLRDDELAEVIAHEAYHLFYSVRHLIDVDEEVEALVFGQLVRRIHRIVIAEIEPKPCEACIDGVVTAGCSITRPLLTRKCDKCDGTGKQQYGKNTIQLSA